MPGEGGQLKMRGTCELQEKRLLFRGFSGFMSLNMDHVHRRRGGITPQLPCPAYGYAAVKGKSSVRLQGRLHILFSLHYRNTHKGKVFSLSA